MRRGAFPIPHVEKKHNPQSWVTARGIESKGGRDRYHNVEKLPSVGASHIYIRVASVMSRSYDWGCPRLSLDPPAAFFASTLSSASPRG
jgi:hypothetical protein